MPATPAVSLQHHALAEQLKNGGKGRLTKKVIQKFSRCAWHYILAYFYLEHVQEENINEEGLHELNIERIQKEFKTQWSAIDFDEKFINHCFRRQETPGASRSGKQQSTAAACSRGNQYKIRTYLNYYLTSLYSLLLSYLFQKEK
jgi:hypothetical protein